MSRTIYTHVISLLEYDEKLKKRKKSLMQLLTGFGRRGVSIQGVLRAHHHQVILHSGLVGFSQIPTVKSCFIACLFFILRCY